MSSARERLTEAIYRHTDAQVISNLDAILAAAHEPEDHIERGTE